MTENGGDAANAAGPGVPAAEALGSTLTPKVARGHPQTSAGSLGIGSRLLQIRRSWREGITKRRQG